VITAARDQRSFPFELDSVRAARHFVNAVLAPPSGVPVVDDTVADDAAIVITELAANAVLHACSAFTVTIERSAAALTILVGDTTPLEPGDAAAPFEIRAGHGLSVVVQLASRWGVGQTEDGKVVWVELALPAQPSGPEKSAITAPGQRQSA
jgi:anti-sigma regulatory factor (Ser/Thr protein kinase)